MEGADYYHVLRLSKRCTKKEIADAYLQALRESPSPEKRALLDRALLVLRISYLRYVYDNRGEPGLREERCVKTIGRGMKAIAHVRSRGRKQQQKVPSSLWSSTSTKYKSSLRSTSSSHTRNSKCTSRADQLHLRPDNDRKKKGNNVTEWLDQAWRHGMLVPKASSSMKSKLSSRISRDKKTSSAMELFPNHPPSPIHASSSFKEKLETTETSSFDYYSAEKISGKKDEDYKDDNLNHSARYFFSQARHKDNDKRRRNGSLVAADSAIIQSVICVPPPRPILGGRDSQKSMAAHPVVHPSRYDPYSRDADSLSRHSTTRHRYAIKHHLQRPLMHWSKNTPTSTMRVLIQK